MELDVLFHCCSSSTQVLDMCISRTWTAQLSRSVIWGLADIVSVGSSPGCSAQSLFMGGFFSPTELSFAMCCFCLTLRVDENQDVYRFKPVWHQSFNVLLVWEQKRTKVLNFTFTYCQIPTTKLYEFLNKFSCMWWANIKQKIIVT